MTTIKDIPQNDNETCPACKTKNKPYGSVDTPPIAIQMQDIQNGTTRKWHANRYCCEQCLTLYDHVITNEVIGDADH